MFLESNIAYQNQTSSSEKLQALLLSFKEQKTQDDSTHDEVHYQEQLYIEVKLTRGKYCRGFVIKKREFCALIL